MSLPKRFQDRVEIAVVRRDAERLQPGDEAADVATRSRNVAGRVMARREMGKVTFLDLVDRSGRIQLFCPANLVEGLSNIHLGDIVGVGGWAMRTKRGEPSMFVADLQLLAKNRQPLPDTFHGVKDVELRYRKRYLDLLMSQESRDEAIKRAQMVSAIRTYLDGEDFIEVETPILQPRYGGGFAEPFVTRSELLDAELYLRIADELYLKRLIVGGLEKVYEISKDFRNESYSYKHSPEFTQLEWYEAYVDYKDTAARLKELVRHAAEATIGGTRTTFRGHDVDLSQWQEVRFVEALDAHGVWTRDEAELRAKLTEARVDVSRDRSWAQLADHAYSHFVEPELIQPSIVYDWPIELSPFARTTDHDETLVERFEAVVSGMEIANAFSELNDAEEQEQRFAMQGVERDAGDVEAEPGDPDYVEAMSYGMAPNGGCGVGIDRLAMVLLGKDAIRDVILFPALSEAQVLVDLALPSVWGFGDVASLIPDGWWDRHAVPLASQLLAEWVQRGSGATSLVLEADLLESLSRALVPAIEGEVEELRQPWMGPYMPEWWDWKITVRQSVASVLSRLHAMPSLRSLLDRVRPVALRNAETVPSMEYEVLGTLNGLALLSIVRQEDSLASLRLQRDFLQICESR